MGKKREDSGILFCDTCKEEHGKPVRMAWKDFTDDHRIIYVCLRCKSRLISPFHIEMALPSGEIYEVEPEPEFVQQKPRTNHKGQMSLF